MEKNNLAVTTTHCNLVMSNSLYALNTLSTDTLGKNEHFVFDLVGAEISRSGTNEQKFFVWFGKGHAGVISYHGSSLHNIVICGALHSIQRPQGQFLGSSYGKLVVLCVPELDVLDESAPTY